jgi:hypothetical protein
MINAKIVGMLIVAFVAGSFIASPELRAYAANTIGSSDIINESILSEDIKNGQVKAADIATDAVGAAEIVGVTKLLFAQCSPSEAVGAGVSEGGTVGASCSISGVDSDDTVIATLNDDNNPCYDVGKVTVASGKVTLGLRNNCNFTTTFITGDTISLIVFDK